MKAKRRRELGGVPYRFQRSRWDLEGRERQRRSISTQRDWIWVRSLLMDAESSGVCDSKLPPLEYSRRSSRSSASRVLNWSFFAFWYISDSVLPPPPPPPSNGVAADADSISNREKERCWEWWFVLMGSGHCDCTVHTLKPNLLWSPVPGLV